MGVGGVSQGPVPEYEPDPAAAPPPDIDTGGPGLTPLQRHVAFFDGNKDGVITPAETREGLAKLGMTGAGKFLAGSFINVTLGPKTTGGLSVSVPDIAKAKHGGDTGVFDANGNFDRAKFDRIWTTFDTDHDGKLTEDEVSKMTTENSTAFTFGRIATKGEFTLLMSLAGQDDPATGKKVVTRERLSQLYDGSLFPRIAIDRARASAAAHGAPQTGGVAAPGRTSGGPLAGAAAGARMGQALLTDDPARSPEVAATMAGGMQATCPFLAAGGKPPGAGE